MKIDYEAALAFADREVAAKDFDVGRVSEAVRTVYLITQLDFEVTVGGIEQWLSNTSGGYAAETATALEQIGALTCAKTVREAIGVFPNGAVPKNEQERVLRVHQLRHVAASLWRECANRLLQWPDDVDGLLRAFVARHCDEFGPRPE